MKEAKFVEKVESHEVGSKRKKDASKSPSPKKSPRLSRIKEKIADAMSHKETSPVKHHTHVVKKRSPKKAV